MAKLFLEESYEPIEIELKTLKGESFVVKSNLLTIGDLDYIDSLQKDEKIPVGKQIKLMMVKIFGETEEFWEQFSLTLLTQLSLMVTEEIKKKANVT